MGHQETQTDTASGDVVLPTRNVGSSFCNQDNNQHAVISFDAVHGDVPNIKADVTNLKDLVGVTYQPGVITTYSDGQSVQSVTSVQGTTEDVECNGRGICDRTL